MLLALLPVGLVAPPLAHAQEAEKAAGKNAVDTEFIFGFTAGADTGEVGERELENETIARWGKRGGSYSALFDQLRLELVPFENFRVEIGVPAAVHDIAGVPGLDDRRRAAFDGLAGEFRYKLLDRGSAPFSLTVGAELHSGRVDETSGEPVDDYGGELSIAADKELIKDRVFAALNFTYDPEVTRSRVTGLWQREATLGVLAAATTQVRPGVFVGAEARYFRNYSGLGLDPFAGHALFLGPATLVRLSNALAVSAAWGVQVAGHAVDGPGSLDLSNFTRHQATFRLEYNF